MPMPKEATLLQITDLHVLPEPGEKMLGVDTEATFHAVLDKALAENEVIDLILVTGDIAQHPCSSSYERIQTKLDSLKIPSLCLPGNHDDDELMRQILNFGFVSCRKQYFLKNWHIICLNSQIPGAPGGHLSAGELSFLEGCLKENRKYPTVIAVHHHCLKTGSIWMDAMMIDNSLELFATVAKYPQVKAIICGHIHQEMNLQAGSVHLWGTPSTCFQFTPESRQFSVEDTAPGYRLFKLYADGRIESKVSRLSAKLTGLQINSDNY
jgi:Icc protein